MARRRDRPRCGFISKHTGKPCGATAGLCTYHPQTVPIPISRMPAALRFWSPSGKTKEELAEANAAHLRRLHAKRAAEREAEKERVAEMKAAAERHEAWVRAPKVIRMKGGSGW